MNKKEVSWAWALMSLWFPTPDTIRPAISHSCYCTFPILVNPSDHELESAFPLWTCSLSSTCPQTWEKLLTRLPMGPSWALWFTCWLRRLLTLVCSSLSFSTDTKAVLYPLPKLPRLLPGLEEVRPVRLPPHPRQQFQALHDNALRGKWAPQSLLIVGSLKDLWNPGIQFLIKDITRTNCKNDCKLSMGWDNCPTLPLDEPSVSLYVHRPRSLTIMLLKILMDNFWQINKWLIKPSAYSEWVSLHPSSFHRKQENWYASFNPIKLKSPLVTIIHPLKISLLESVQV